MWLGELDGLGFIGPDVEALKAGRGDMIRSEGEKVIDCKWLGVGFEFDVTNPDRTICIRDKTCEQAGRNGCRAVPLTCNVYNSREQYWAMAVVANIIVAVTMLLNISILR